MGEETFEGLSDAQGDAKFAELAAGVAARVLDIHAYWLPQRGRHVLRPATPASAGAVTARRDTPKVGRNDACPCGSGRKFKKCCGTSAND